MASGTIQAYAPVTISVTDTTTSSGAFPIPTAVQNGKFVSAYVSGAASLIFRRDYSYFTIKDASTLQPRASESLTVVITYIP